jgi:hypothetical protein
MSVRPLSTSLPGTGRWSPTCENESVTAWGERPVQPNTAYDNQPMIVPTMIAASPPGMPNGSRTPAVHDSRMIANVASAIHAALNISNDAFIEMNATEMPARVPSIAARGVYFLIVGPMNAPISTMMPMRKAQASPACQACRTSPVRPRTGSMITNVTKK